MTPTQSGGSTPPRKTLLQLYLDRNGITSAKVEREAHVSRRQMARWRLATSDIRLRQMIRILRALRSITAKPVRMDEVFDLEPENWPI